MMTPHHHHLQQQSKWGDNTRNRHGRNSSIGKIFATSFRSCSVISIVMIFCHQVFVYQNYYYSESKSLTIYNYDLHNSQQPFTTIAAAVKINDKNNNVDAIDSNTKGKLEAKKMIPCPKEYLKKVWFKGGSTHKLYEPVIRAFHSRGWSVTKNQTRAHVLWTDQPNNNEYLFTTLQPWQRYNQLPLTKMWDDKDEMALHMNDYYQKRKKMKMMEQYNETKMIKNDDDIDYSIEPLHSFPESYVLHLTDGLEAFRIRLLEENGGLDVPWVLKEPTVNQGKGVKIIGPHSKQLKTLISRIEKVQQEQQKDAPRGSGTNYSEEVDDNDDDDDDPALRLVIQRYICDEMTFTGSRKFDFRIFWTVASIDPLIVLYHTTQNYVRIGHAKHDESNFRSTKSHLTTHTFGSSETKATWDEFREYVERHVFESKYRSRFVPTHTSSTSTATDRTINLIRQDPFGHVQNQMKTIIGHLSDAYKDITFNGRSMEMENGFSWHAADIIIDNNLDAFIIEGTDGPGKDEDYDFRIIMHDEILGKVVDIVEEVVKRQEQGRPLDVHEMKKDGIFGGYEVVYNDGWMFDYRYERLPQKGCVGTDFALRSTSVTLRKQQQTIIMANKSTPIIIEAPTIVPATYTALPKKSDNDSNVSKSKTFWMRSRTNQRSEPVARSLRHNGWIPVDKPEVAQLVYYVDDRYELNKNESRLWQYVSQYPSQYRFFESNYLKYLDVRNVHFNNDEEYSTNCICRPILHRGRSFKIVVYWVVLSLDPIRVLYHDGFVHFEYSQDDENEFITLRNNERGGKKTGKRIWRGSWTSLEHYVNSSHRSLVSSLRQTNLTSDSSIAAATINLEPMSHVRNQMKHSLVKMAEGFIKSSKSKYLSPSRNKSFALFTANFEIDQNLNTLFTDSYHSYMEGEDHSEMVYLHNDIFGSAFNLLEYFNSTNPLTRDDEVLGRYEWLIQVWPKEDVTETPQQEESDRKRHDTLWKFKYPWKHKAKECLTL